MVDRFVSNLNKVLNQSVGDLNEAAKNDIRPDWVKAASYEMMFIGQELEMARKAVVETTSRLDNVEKWATALAENLQQHVPKS